MPSIGQRGNLCWTEEEDRALEAAIAAGKTSQECGIDGRNPESCRNRASYKRAHGVGGFDWHAKHGARFKDVPWTEPEIAELKRTIAAGLTARECNLPARSKAARIAKASKMKEAGHDGFEWAHKPFGLSTPAERARMADARRKSGMYGSKWIARRGHASTKVGPPPEYAERPPGFAHAPLVGVPPVEFMDLESKHCRFPLSHGLARRQRAYQPTYFCGHKRDTAGPYCCVHRALCHHQDPRVGTLALNQWSPRTGVGLRG